MGIRKNPILLIFLLLGTNVLAQDLKIREDSADQVVEGEKESKEEKIDDKTSLEKSVRPPLNQIIVVGESTSETEEISEKTQEKKDEPVDYVRPFEKKDFKKRVFKKKLYEKRPFKSKAYDPDRYRRK